MFRRSPRPIAALVLTGAIIAATPALAHASHGSTHPARVGLNNSVSSGRTAPSTGTDTAQPAGAVAFPSGSSSVVGSVGFIDAEQVGFFWSAARGDSVEQIINGPAKINKAILRLDVTDNSLSAGNRVDWELSINGEDLGTFSISSGRLGEETVRFKFGGFPRGGVYDVKIRAVNEVPVGGGSIALRYDGAGAHSITLKAKK